MRSKFGAAAVAAAVALLLFPGVLLRGESFSSSDLAGLHRPLLRVMLSLAKASDGLPLWNPLANFGQPFAANPGNHLFHPFTALFFVLPFELAFNLPILLAPFLAFGGMYFLLRTLGRSRGAALLGGVAWGLGGYVLSTTIYLPTLYGVPWLAPMVAFTVRLARPGGKRTDAVGLAACFAMACAAAEPTLLVATPVVVALGLFEAWRTSPTGGRFSRRTAVVAATLLLGMLLAASTLLPGFALAGRTSRADRLSAKDADSWSMPPVRVAEFVSPNIFGHQASTPWPWSWGRSLYPDRDRPYVTTIYPGLLTTLLAFVALRRRPLRFSPWWLAGVAGLLLAFGRHAPAWPLARHFPVISGIRYPEKFVVAPLFVLAVLAAFGLDAALAAPGRGRRRWSRPLVALAVGALALSIVAPAIDWSRVVPPPAATTLRPMPSPDGRGIAFDAANLAVVAAAIAWALARSRRLAPARAAWLLVGLLAVDLVARRPQLPTSPSDQLETPPPVVAELLVAHPSGPVFHLLAWSPRVAPVRGNGAPPVPMQWGIPLGFEPDFDLTQLRWSAHASELAMKAIAAHPARVEPILRRRGVAAIVSLQRSNGGKGGDASPFDRFGVTGVRAPRPFASCLDRVAIVGGEAGWLDAVARGGPELADTALVERSESDGLPEAPSPCALSTTVHRPGALALDIDAAGPAPSLLALNQTWDRGWWVTIDSVPARLRRTDVSLQAVAIPPGRHHVELVYDDPSVHAGVVLSLAALAVLATIALWRSGRAAA